MESILNSIKKLLGPTEECEHFDSDIIMHINSVFMDLNQIGVGPSKGFIIEDELAVWSDFLPDPDVMMIEAVKSYMYLRVKMLFDPQSLTPSVMESMNRQIEKWEWRLNHQVETGRGE